jgi:hypothetical protein
MKKQIELLKKYGVTNYTIENDVITINGSLYLNSLTSVERMVINSNVKKLVLGYNKEKSYCFFDEILSKVVSVSIKKSYTIYTTYFGFVVEKEGFTSHGNTVKKAIQDLKFKVVSETLKKYPFYCKIL